MTGDHAREWTSVPRRSRRDDGACPIPPNRAPTPVRASQFWVLGFCPSQPDAGRTFLAFLAPPLGAMVASFGPRSVAGRSETCGAPNGVARHERSSLLSIDVNRGSSPGPLLELREIRLEDEFGRSMSSRFLRGASPNQPRAMATLVSCAAMAPRVAAATHRRVSRAAPPRRRGARRRSRLEGPMTVRRARSRQRTAPSARWTPCSACPATKTTRPPRRNRTVSSRTRTAKSRRAIPPKPTR